MDILLDDLPYNPSFFPFAQVRSLAHIRLGILTIFEKWAHYFPGKVFIASEIAQKGGERDSSRVTFPANYLPSHSFLKDMAEAGKPLAIPENSIHLTRPWHLLKYNDWALRDDFTALTSGRTSLKIPEGTRVVGEQNIFIEEGARIYFSIINAEEGPVYIGKNALVMEGCLVRGPLSLGHNSVVKMGTKIYGASTIGPNCVAGGEIKNSILMDWSNKAHDGYLGDSVVDQWCNLGAGTSNSNLKNNVSDVKVWAKDKSDFISAGLKCGLFMGSYSRSAINTSFNTGTVVGCNCNVFGAGFPPKFIDNFTWGNEPYELSKALNDLEGWQKLKGAKTSSAEKEKLITIYKKSNHEKTDSSR